MKDGGYRSWVGSVVELHLILMEREQSQRWSIVEEEGRLSRQHAAHLRGLNDSLISHLSKLHSIQLASLRQSLEARRAEIQTEESRFRERIRVDERTIIQQLIRLWVDSLEMLVKATV